MGKERFAPGSDIPDRSRIPIQVLTDETYLAPWDYTANGIEGVYGIPANVNIGTVFYANKKLLEDNGLQVPETWEEINEMLRP